MQIKHGDVSLNVIDEGPRNAAVLMFSHSLAANHHMWDPQAASLMRDYRVVRYDTRGHGRSSVPPGDYTLAELQADVIAVLDHLQIARVHFIGLSLGGMTAIGLALSQAGRLRSITAANCVAQVPQAAHAMWDERMETARSRGLEALVEPTIGRWFTPDMLATRGAEVERVRDMIRGTPVGGYVGCCAAIKALAYLEHMDRITTPALFIAGNSDAGAPSTAMQDMARRVAGARFVELLAAHISNMECVDAFSNAVFEHVCSVERRGG